MVPLQSQTCFCTFFSFDIPTVLSFLAFIINCNFLFFRANNGNRLQDHDDIGGPNPGYNGHEEDVL